MNDRRPCRTAARRRAVALLVVPLALAACGGGSGSPTATVPAATGRIAATPTPMPPAAVGEVVWARAVDPATRAPVAPAEEFAADAPALYAVVRVEHLPAGASLSAAWSYNDNRLDIAVAPVVAGAPVGGGFVEFHLAREGDAPWPDGRYAVAISLDGRVVATGEVAVVDP